MATARPRTAVPHRVSSLLVAGALGLTLAVSLQPTTAHAASVQAATTTTSGVVAQDDFKRTSTSGWGTAGTGGAWTVNGGAASDFTLANGSAQMKLRGAGWQLGATLRGAVSHATEVRTRMALGARPVGGAVDLDVVTRAVDEGQGYLVRTKFNADGTVRVSLVVMAGGKATTLQSATLPGTYAPGTQLELRAQTAGRGTATHRAKVWAVGSTEPADWQVSVTDTTTALQREGYVGLRAYTGSGVTNIPAVGTFTGFVAGPLGGTPAPGGTATQSAPAPTPTPTPTQTATPTPAPTQAPAPAPSREIGTYVPDASTTGVPAGTQLTVHQGDLLLSTPNQVVSGLDVRGVVKVTAANVTIKNSIIRGKATSSQTALVTNTSDASSVTIEDSELYNATPGPWIDGVRGWNFTLRRVNLHHVIDMAHIYGNNVTIEGSWLHDNLHYDVDPAQNNTPSHDDSIQIQVGKNIRIYGNNITGAKNTGIQFTQDRGIVSDVTIQKNHLDGGGCTINMAEKGKGPFQRITITDNTFGRTTKHYNCAIISPTTTKLTTSGNYFTDGTVANVRKG